MEMIKHEPEPVEPPQVTYDFTGLTEWQATVVRVALYRLAMSRGDEYPKDATKKGAAELHQALWLCQHGDVFFGKYSQ